MAKVLLNLPEEILEEILIRVPCKSLCRFLAVCKPWCRLITSQAFISSHLNRNRRTASNNHMLLRVCRLVDDVVEEEFSFYPHHQANNVDLGVPSSVVKLLYEKTYPRTYYKIIGTCNGLICMLENSKLFLFNPSIRKVVELPPYSLSSPASTYRHVFGFGVNLSNGDFKVVRVLVVGDRTLCEVYSLKIGEWVEINGGSQNLVCPFPVTPHVYLNGRSHWFGSVVGNQPSGSIISFDMSDEVFRKVSVPEQLARKCECTLMEGWDKVTVMLTMTVGDKECLAMAINEGSIDFGSLRIWAMKEYGDLESWTNIYSIDKEAIQSNVMRTFRVVKFIMNMNNGHILIIGGLCSRLACYDLLSKLYSEVDMNGFGMHVCKYMESLVLLERSRKNIIPT